MSINGGNSNKDGSSEDAASGSISNNSNNNNGTNSNIKSEQHQVKQAWFDLYDFLNKCNKKINIESSYGLQVLD